MKKIIILLCVAALLLGTCACAAKKRTPAKETTTAEAVTNNTAGKDVAVDDSLNELISACVVEQEKGNYKKYDRFEEAHEILGAKTGDLEGKKPEKYITVYFLSLFGGYVKVGEDYETSSAGAHPSAIVFEKKGEAYVFTKYWAPEMNDDMEKEVKAVFPEDIFEKIPLETEPANALIENLDNEIQTKLQKS